ncbi:MAG TPA: hypothetical protein VGN34_26730, partial [Ktedonobacteraceae bacterium]
TEDYKAYLATAISAILTLFTIKTWDLANVGVPIYILVLDLSLVCLITYKPGKRLKERVSAIKEIE